MTHNGPTAEVLHGFGGCQSDPTRGIIKRRVTYDVENVSSALFHFVAVVAGLGILATGLIVFPRADMKGLAKGLAVTISLAVIAAFLIAAARSFGP
jgi:hypothetical protein